MPPAGQLMALALPSAEVGHGSVCTLSVPAQTQLPQAAIQEARLSPAVPTAPLLTAHEQGHQLPHHSRTYPPLQHALRSQLAPVSLPGSPVVEPIGLQAPSSTAASGLTTLDSEQLAVLGQDIAAIGLDSSADARLASDPAQGKEVCSTVEWHGADSISTAHHLAYRASSVHLALCADPESANLNHHCSRSSAY